MEPLSGPVDPAMDQLVTWGFRIFWVVIIACIIRAFITRPRRADEKAELEDKEDH